jgi:pimeloyl-ACP methyl ester carboxylesterase
MTPEYPSDPDVQQLALARGPGFFTEEGEGPAIVLIHGIPGSERDFRWFCSAMGPEFRCLRLVIPGFGGAPLETMPYPRLMARGRFVVEVLEALEVDDALILGHSMGGAIAAAAVSLQPERFLGLGLLASVGFRAHRSFRSFKFATPLSLAMRTPLIKERLLPRVRAESTRVGFKGHDDVALAQMVHTVASFSFAQHAKNLSQLELPTLVAWAEDDRFIEPAISKELYWRCPTGPRLEFPEGGHNIQKSRAVELAAAVTVWAKQLAQAEPEASV